MDNDNLDHCIGLQYIYAYITSGVVVNILLHVLECVHNNHIHTYMGAK